MQLGCVSSTSSADNTSLGQRYEPDYPGFNAQQHPSAALYSAHSTHVYCCMGNFIQAPVNSLLPQLLRIDCCYCHRCCAPDQPSSHVLPHSCRLGPSLRRCCSVLLYNSQLPICTESKVLKPQYCTWHLNPHRLVPRSLRRATRIQAGVVTAAAAGAPAAAL
jgi:hypothetical protein